MSLRAHVGRYVRLKQRLGYKFVDHRRMLLDYAEFAAARNEEFTRTQTMIDWASHATSRQRSCIKLRIVRAFAISVHAEDGRHQIPPRDVFGRRQASRPRPHLPAPAQIRQVMDAALRLPPANTITPHTWHYLFGLIAVTGLRSSEAIALLLSDITPDGLVVRETKHRKTRLVPLHPDTRAALDDYLDIRKQTGGLDDHVFVLSTGRPPAYSTAYQVFLRLARQTGLRGEVGAPGPSPHSLRHAFAVRSLAELGEGEDASRHMLALSTYLGHSEVSYTYWYLEATPGLLRSISETAEQAQTGRMQP